MDGALSSEIAHMGKETHMRNKLLLLAILAACGDKDNTTVDSGDDTGDTGTIIVDADGDGFSVDDDCDDNDATVNPGAEEVPGDSIDNNCDGISTNSATTLWNWEGAANLTEGYDVAICESDGGLLFVTNYFQSELYGFLADTTTTGENTVVAVADAHVAFEGTSGSSTGIYAECFTGDGGEFLAIGADDADRSSGNAFVVSADTLADGGELDVMGDETLGFWSSTESAYLGSTTSYGDVTGDGCDDWFGVATGAAHLWVMEGDCSGNWSGYYEIETEMNISLDLCTDESGGSIFCGIGLATTSELLCYVDPEVSGGYMGCIQLPLTADSTEIYSNTGEDNSSGLFRIVSDGRNFFTGNWETDTVTVHDGITGEAISSFVGETGTNFGFGLSTCTDVNGDDLLVVGAPLWTDRGEDGAIYVYNLSQFVDGYPTSYDQAAWFARGGNDLTHLGFSTDCGVVEHDGERKTVMIGGNLHPYSQGSNGSQAFILE
jgi:hypothetical protein